MEEIRPPEEVNDLVAALLKKKTQPPPFTTPSADLTPNKTRPALAVTDYDKAKDFYVMITGRLESADFPLTRNNLYCRYSFVYGPDWSITHGVESGITQMGRVPFGHATQHATAFNFPIEISFQANNIHGWPRIVVAVYGLDFLGRDVARGYVSVLCPLTPGMHVKCAKLYTPCSSNIMQSFSNLIYGVQPEFYDSKFVTQDQGRALTFVEGTGTVKLMLNVLTKQIKDFGYDVGEVER